MTAIVFLPPAQEEMTAAARYYQTQSMGLGTEFLAEVERTIAAIASHPKAAPKVKQDIRRRLLKRFPFGILYVSTVDEMGWAAWSSSCSRNAHDKNVLVRRAHLRIDQAAPVGGETSELGRIN